MELFLFFCFFWKNIILVNREEIRPRKGGADTYLSIRELLAREW